MSEAVEELIRRFEELEDLERQAFFLYKKLLPYVLEAADKNILQGVIDDENRHAKMARNAIEILQKENPST